MILPIKKKWFDMLLSGEKKEEYREIKSYHMTRFQTLFPTKTNTQNIIFRNGYSKKSPQFEAVCSFRVGKGKTEWGAEKDKNYFILKILCITKIMNKNCVHCDT